MQSPYRIAAGVVGIVLATIVGVWLIIALSHFLIIVLIAAVFAAGLDRPVNWLKARLGLHRRGHAVAIVFLLGIGILVGVGYMASAPIASQSSSLRRDLPNRVERLKDLPLVGNALRDVDLKRQTEDFLSDLPGRLGGNRTLLLGVARTALEGFALTATTLVIAVFMLLNGPTLIDGFVSLISDPAREARARRIGRRVLDAQSGYVLGRIVLSAIAAAVTALSLAVMGVPFVAALAVMMFVLSFIPLVGVILGGGFVTAAAFIFDPQPWKAIAFAIIFTAYQQVENHSLQPVVMGRAVNIGAFPVFLMTIAGVELAGFVGALLSIPIGAAVNVVVQDVIAERRRKKAGTASAHLVA